MHISSSSCFHCVNFLHWITKHTADLVHSKIGQERGLELAFNFDPLRKGGRRVTQGPETVLLDCSSGFDCPNSWRLPLLHLSAVNRPPARTLSAWWIYGHAECPHSANYRRTQRPDSPACATTIPNQPALTCAATHTYTCGSHARNTADALPRGRRLTELSTRKH